MKTSLLLFLLLLTNLSKGRCQEIATVQDLKPFFYDLPLDADKETIIHAAKSKFKGNIIVKDTVVANTKLYFEDSTITYEYFSSRPLVTRLRLYDLWSLNEPHNTDTTFYIVIEAYYGEDNKARRRMYAAYHSLLNRFDNSFHMQMPYTMQADVVEAKGYNFYVSSIKKPILTVGWNNGGCFRNYYTRVLFRL